HYWPSGAAPLSLDDCLCQICMEVFVEPVTLPCNHTICNSCFQLTVENASLCCPFCRRRVSSWARYNARRNTLINWELWEKIQKKYPKECERRMNGQDLEEEIFVPHPQHQLSKPGELRQEYEAEVSKVEAERRAHEQEENKASEEYIQKLLAEEEEEHRLAEERRKEMEEQLKQDEKLAWQLSNSLVNSLSRESPPASLCKTKNKPKVSFLQISINEGSSTEGQDEQEEMPALSPQLSGVTKCSSDQDLFMQTYINFVNASASEKTTTVEQKNAHESNCLRDELLNTTCGFAGGEGDRAVLPRSKGEDGIVVDTINSTSDGESVIGDHTKMAGNEDEREPESLPNTKEAPKRKSSEPLAEAVVDADLDMLDKKRRTFPETLEEEAEWKSDFYLQMQKAFEQELHERRVQEEQDRLLALQLQRQFNKEERLLNRQKGSPDEYLLRAKTPQSVKDSSRKGSSKMAKDSKQSKKQSETNHHKGRKGSCDENWQSPTRVRMKSPSSGKVLNCVVNTNDSNDVHSVPKRRQKTILQMLKSPE
uniref:RING-type E3 ubiquitin transferase n=1 Tax=Coturnix japonica TaxID=93934 RepID=A0A8C2SR73_COTJA